jgi:UPF0755 protein
MSKHEIKVLTKNQFTFVLVSFFVFWAIGYYLLFFPIGYSVKEPFVLEVQRGEGLNSVTEKLYDNGIIKNKFLFKIVAKIFGAENQIKAARFKIKNGLSYIDLVELLVNGPADYLKSIKIYEGSTLNNIATMLNQEVKIDTADFFSLSYDEVFLKSLNINANSLEGYLMPGRYFVYENSSAQEVIKILNNQLNEFWNDSMNIQAQKLKLDKHKVLTLASIIEGETNNTDEMRIISAVYHNRLKKGMKLQADPTVQYALNGKWRRLYYKDLKVDSPYNTYKYFGLPPGPINNPSKEAILAALYPADVDYFFFVADGSGKHKFAKTYQEHLNNVREYRKWLKSKNSN